MVRESGPAVRKEIRPAEPGLFEWISGKETRMRIALVYFSATENTAQVAEAIAARLTEKGDTVDIMDITLPDFREKRLDMSQYEAAVFGFPVHYLRAPRIAREWIARLDGQGKKCVTFFTYGGFRIHPAHFNTRQLLEDRGFHLVASADFPCKHTFNLAGWQAMIDRPDESDFKIAREFAEVIHARFSGEDPGVVGELEQKRYTEEDLDKFEQARFQLFSQFPSREGADCAMCLECEELCPVGAMDARTGQADRDLCIVCLRCLYICPEQALSVSDASFAFDFRMERDKETPETLRQKQGRIFK